MILTAAAALVLAAPVQEPVPVPITTALRDAGVYHLATGTWSRHGAPATLGPDVIFNSTHPSGYFATGWEGSEGVDEGVLPGPDSPYGGPQTQYTIDGFQFAYCSLADTVTWTFRFYDSYTPCDQPDQPANCLNLAAGPIVLPGMPTASACWIVTVDLSGNDFCMQADGGPCNPGVQGIVSGLDHFGWGSVWETGDGAPTGPILAGGNPQWAPPGEGTCYLPGLTCPAGATALGFQDFFGIAAPYSGCYFTDSHWKNGCGGYSQGAVSQFHCLLFTDCTAGDCDLCADVYCELGPEQLGELAITTCSLAGGPVLESTGLTGGLYAYHLVGGGSQTISDPAGALGDLCVAGSPSGIGRYVADLGAVVEGEFRTDLIHGATGGGSGDLPSPPGGSLAVGQSWNFQTWVRVSDGSRFSPALNVLFLD